MPFFDISQFASKHALSKFDEWGDRVYGLPKCSEVISKEPDGSSIDCIAFPGMSRHYLELVDDKGRKTEWDLGWYSIVEVLKTRKLEYEINDSVSKSLNSIKTLPDDRGIKFKHENIGFSYYKEFDEGRVIYGFSYSFFRKSKLDPFREIKELFYVESEDKEMIKKIIESMTFDFRDKAVRKIQNWWMEILLNPHHPVGKKYLGRKASEVCDY